MSDKLQGTFGSENSSATSEKEMGFHLGYRPALDGLRGVFFLTVLAYHAALIDFGGVFARGGFLGVDGFFVLSGFLITTLLLQESAHTGGISLTRFYARRALRLLPALGVFVLVALIYAKFFSAGEEARLILRDIVPVLFYHLNWIYALDKIPGSLLNHAWSLSVEEQFYLLWPLLLIGMLRVVRNRRWIIALALLGIGAAALWRARLFQNETYDLRLYVGLDTRADTLLVGCLIGLLASWNLLPKSPHALSVKAIAIVSTLLYAYFVLNAALESDYLYLGSFTLIAAAAGAVIVMLLSAPIALFANVLESAPLVWVGRLSYGLYLWHFPAFMVLNPARLSLPPVVALTIQTAATFGVAILSFYLVEQPFLQLKRKLGAVSRRVATGQSNPV